MVGSPTAVIAAIARTAAPAILGDGRAGNPPAVASGNLAAGRGQALPAPPPPPPAPAFDFSEVARQLNAFVENGDRSVKFRLDEFTGLTVMTVVNPTTQEVIRQVPPAEVLALARSIDHLRGQLINAET